VRIVAVTDIFDALISRRSYKEYWSNKQEIQALKQLAGEKLDQYCVNALLDNMAQV
jgi:HD-GYP domain-containing protein (c-di-GMP phosphodiesterase class II)